MPPIKLYSRSWGERSARWAARWAGNTWTFLLAVGTILVWLLTGPFFDFSDTWQLVINTSTTIITFLMVFLIQRSQNKEAEAVQIKLNEILAALQGASSRLINVEDLTEHEMHDLHQRYQALAEAAARNGDFCAAHSIEEMKANVSPGPNGDARA